MEKLVTIGDKQMRFVCTMGTTIRYRSLFHVGMMEDVQRLISDFTDHERINDELLARIAYAMAKQGNPEITNDLTEWLDQFDLYAFYEAMPEIISLWNESSTPSVYAKKKQ